MVKPISPRTRAFAAIYTEVTDQLLMRINRQKRPAGAQPWFIALINAFANSYTKWETDPSIKAYLDRFEKPKHLLFVRLHRPRVCAMFGQIYLHIAYDLARDVADSLQRLSAYGLTKIDARGVYLAQGTVFLDLMEQAARKRGNVGGVAYLNRLVPRRLSLFHTMGYWIVALRTSSWVLAETLHELSPNDRTVLEKKILVAVDAAAQLALRHSWFRMPSFLIPPTAFFSSMIAQSVIQTPTALPGRTWILGVIATGLTLVALSYYVSMTRFADRLGRGISCAVAREIAKFRPLKDS